MFWGIVLENGKRYTQVVDDGFHISMAALEPQLDKKGKANDSPVSIMMEREKTEFLLCTLSHGKQPQQTLDLNFAEGEAVTLFLNGEGVVHLTGYVIEGEPEDQELSYSEDDEDDEVDIDELQDDCDELEAYIKGAEKAIKRKPQHKNQIESVSKKPKIEELFEDDSSLGEEDDEDDDEDDEEDEEEVESSSDDEEDALMVKNQKSQSKKTPMKNQIGGLPLASKLSPSPTKKVTIAATPKNENKKQAVLKTPVPSEKNQQQNKNAKGAQTPASNGEKSPNESASAKKRRKRNKKKSLNASTSAPTQSNDDKSPLKNENNAQKTPNKAQNNVEKTPNKAQNNAQKTPSKVQKKLAGGVLAEDLKVGHGPEAKPGKMVHVHYIGKLPNNKEFDSCLKGQEPFKFRLGGNEVIKGWDTGLQGMKVGGRRKLVIPPNQAYGNRSMGSIPANSTLTFEVQLVSVS